MTTASRKAALVSQISKSLGVTEPEAIAYFRALTPTFQLEDIHPFWANDTFQVKPFGGRGEQLLLAANFSLVTLSNPLASGVQLHVTQVICEHIITGEIEVRVQEAAVAGTAGTSRDGRFPGLTAAGEVSGRTSGTTLGDLLLSSRRVGNSMQTFEVDILLRPQQSVNLNGGAVNQSIAGSFVWDETLFSR